MEIKAEHICIAGAIGVGIHFMRKKIAQKKVDQKAKSLAWPTACRVVSSPFGTRAAPIAGASTFHNGIDIACAQPSDVWAAADGTVKDVWFDLQYGGGLSISIEHADGLRTGYCHLSDTAVKVGQRVVRGELIAQSGGEPGAYGAGNSTGPHLHFTCKQDGCAVDPQKLLA